jgi:ABC-type transport system involved in cytochrome bd biosynthesis fused ATPase/permease subunit
MVYFPDSTLNDRFRGGETSRGRGSAAPEPLLSLLEGNAGDQRADDDSAFHRDSATEDRSDPRGSESLVMDLSCVRGKSRFHFVLNMPLSGVTAVMGESGAGKTTFSQLIAGLIRPTEGFLRLGNRLFADTHRHFFLSAAFPWCSRIIVCSRTLRSAGI